LNYLTLGVCVVEIGFDPETGLNPVLDSGGGGERYGNIQPRTREKIYLLIYKFLV